MSLLDDLKNAAHAVDPQFQVSSNEAQGVLSAAIYYIEHGQAFLDAAAKGVNDVVNLIQPPPPEPAPAEPAPVTSPDAPAASDSELEAQISDLQAQLASRHATEHQTVAVDPPQDSSVI